MRGGKKSERLREREDRSGWRLQQPDRVGLEVEWGWWSGLARSVIGGGGQIGQCIGEPGGARPTVDCQDRSSTCTRRCMVSDRRGGSWVFVDR